MRNYELVCIVQPELDETAFKGVVDRVSSWVTEAGGSVDKVDIWGRRRSGIPDPQAKRRSVCSAEHHSRPESHQRTSNVTSAILNPSCVICSLRVKFFNGILGFE